MKLVHTRPELFFSSTLPTLLLDSVSLKQFACETGREE